MRYISALVTQGSGVMGNLVVEKNGVIRTRNIPANPRTLLQVQRRALLASLAASWRDTLDDVQRAAWNAYAATVVRTDALGKSIKLSGIDVYVSGNAADLENNLGPFIDAPTNTGALDLPAVTTAVGDDSANTLIFTFAAIIPNTQYVYLYLSPSPVSPGRSNYSGPYRAASAQAGAGTGTITFTGFTAAAGQKIGWRLRSVDDQGRVSAEQSGLVTVVA